MSYGKDVIEGDTMRFVTQVVGSCDDALEISFLWKVELNQCAYIFPANVDKSWTESSEVVERRSFKRSPNLVADIKRQTKIARVKAA